jgi:hypothetical protein
MKNEELIVVVNIPDEKENRIQNLLELAKEYKTKPYKTEKTNQSTKFIFEFNDSKIKDDFFNAIPIDWM